MMVKAKYNPNGSKIPSSLIAASALELGMMPLPLSPHSKKPNMDSWTGFRTDLASLEMDFPPGCNIGILNGKPSGGIVDIDLDYDEASAAAGGILPETLVFGRDHRPGSHYLFRCPGARTKKWLDGKRRCILEVRSTGTQTVWAGSVHPDGDLYRMDHPRTILDIGPAALNALLSRLAAVALLVRQYPAGSRHDFIHALTGALRMDGLELEDIRAIVGAVLNGVDDEERSQRLRTMENTLKTEGKTAGWPTLSELIDDAELVRRYIRESVTIAPPDIEIVTKVRKDSWMDPPEGLVKDIAHWAAHRAFINQPRLDMATGLTCLALATQNRYQIGPTALQPYCMTLAPTGGGKDTRLQCVSEFGRQLGLEAMVVEGFQSSHALFDTLGEEPNMACWVWDEAAQRLKAGQRVGSQDHDILNALLSLFGRGRGRFNGMRGRHQTIPQIDNPYFLILAGAQPLQMKEALHSTLVNTGWLSRFLLFDSLDDVGEVNRNQGMAFPSGLLKGGESFRGVGDGIEVRFDNVVAPLDHFQKMRGKLNGKTAYDELWNRTHQHALIIAGLFAVGQCNTKPVITRDIWEYACWMAEGSATQWISRLQESTGGLSDIERAIRVVEDALQDPSTLIPRAANLPQRELLKKGLVPKSVLTRAFPRDLRGNFMAEALERLMDAGQAMEGEKGRSAVYWWVQSGN